MAERRFFKVTGTLSLPATEDIENGKIVDLPSDFGMTEKDFYEKLASIEGLLMEAILKATMANSHKIPSISEILFLEIEKGLVTLEDLFMITLFKFYRDVSEFEDFLKKSADSIKL